MTLYELLLLLHVVAAIVWVGAATTYIALELRTDLSGDVDREASHNDDAGWLAPRLFIPAGLATLGFGILAAIEGSWSFGSLWIIIGLSGFAVSFGIGMAYFEPQIKKLAEAVERDGVDDPGVRRTMSNLKTVGRIELAVLYVVVATMIIKPSGDDGLVLFGFVLALGLVTAAALAWHRRVAPG